MRRLTRRARELRDVQGPVGAVPASEWAQTRAILEVLPTSVHRASEVYEAFLAKFDPSLRAARGFWCTPAPLAEHMVNAVDSEVREQLGMSHGLLESSVKIIDPAAGTGVFMEAVIRLVVRRAEVLGIPVKTAVHSLAERLTGIELMLAPITVARARLAALLRTLDVDVDPRCFDLQRRDTLAEPDVRCSAGEWVTVIVGNPPYARAPAGSRHHGGWILDGHPTWRDGQPPLADFLDPLKASGGGGHAKNLYNSYVYFWRWALWRAMESTAGAAVISLVTSSSYLTGPGFSGMRQHMRQLADTAWVLDLGGEQTGPRRSANVFDITRPVCVTTLVRSGGGAPEAVKYHRVTGDRQGKLDRVRAARSLRALPWIDVATGFLPAPTGQYATWRRLDALLPGRFSGVQLKRTWPIAPTRELLERRWVALLSANDRAAAFRETSAWTVDRAPRGLTPLQDLPSDAPAPAIRPYAHRSFDQRWLLFDERLGDRLRPSLWATWAPGQLYLTTMMSQALGAGPAATVSGAVPDLHHFRGSWGGRDAFPCWLDAGMRRPNSSPDVVAAMTAAHGHAPAPDALFFWSTAILNAPSYTTRFREQLATPGPRIPLPGCADLFSRGVALGRTIASWQAGQTTAADSDVTVVVPLGPELPQTCRFADGTLYVGDGAIMGVTRAVWEFEVSGLRVIRAWVRGRCQVASGRKSSPLDELRPASWSGAMTRSLLGLLHTVSGLIALGPVLDELVSEACKSNQI